MAFSNEAARKAWFSLAFGINRDAIKSAAQAMGGEMLHGAGAMAGQQLRDVGAVPETRVLQAARLCVADRYSHLPDGAADIAII